MEERRRNVDKLFSGALIVASLVNAFFIACSNRNNKAGIVLYSGAVLCSRLCFRIVEHYTAAGDFLAAHRVYRHCWL